MRLRLNPIKTIVPPVAVDGVIAEAVAEITNAAVSVAIVVRGVVILAAVTLAEEATLAVVVVVEAAAEEAVAEAVAAAVAEEETGRTIFDASRR